MNRRAMRRQGWRITARALAAVLAAFAVTACGGLREKVNAVVVTSVPKQVAGCKRLGAVSTDAPEIDSGDGLRQLRFAAVQRGGNAVLVMSLVLSTDGQAYLCDPPLKTDPQERQP